MPQETTFEDFASFISNIEPDAFREVDAQQDVKHMSLSTNPTDMVDGVQRITNILQSRDDSEGGQARIIEIAQQLASNNNIMASVAQYLLHLYTRGVPLGTQLAGNANLGPDMYCLLSTSEDVDVRAALASNPSLPTPTLKVLLEDPEPEVVAAALDNPSMIADLKPTAYIRARARKIHAITSARTDEELTDLYLRYSGDDGLMQALATNEHAPEQVVRSLIEATETTAGQLAHLNYGSGFYFFQYEDEV